MRVTRDGEPVAVLFPEKRWYPVQRQDTTEASIHSDLMGDIYAVIGDPSGDGRWVTRFYSNPMVPWIWIGSLVMVLGGLVSLTDRRLRVGAPTRKPARAPQPTAATGVGD